MCYFVKTCKQTRNIEKKTFSVNIFACNLDSKQDFATIKSNNVAVLNSLDEFFCNCNKMFYRQNT